MDGRYEAAQLLGQPNGRWNAFEDEEADEIAFLKGRTHARTHPKQECFFGCSLTVRSHFRELFSDGREAEQRVRNQAS